MKTLKKLTIITLTGALLFGMTACFNHNPEERAEWMTERIASELELDENQKGKLITLRAEIMNAHRMLQDDRESSSDDIKTLVASEKMDKEAVRALFDRRHKKAEQLAGPVLDKLVDFHASLNAEQKQKIIEFMEEHKGHGPHGWGWDRHW